MCGLRDPRAGSPRPGQDQAFSAIALHPRAHHQHVEQRSQVGPDRLVPHRIHRHPVLGRHQRRGGLNQAQPANLQKINTVGPRLVQQSGAVSRFDPVVTHQDAVEIAIS